MCARAAHSGLRCTSVLYHTRGRRGKGTEPFMLLARIGASRGNAVMSWFIFLNSVATGMWRVQPPQPVCLLRRGGRSEAQPVTARPAGGAHTIYKRIPDFDGFSFCFLAHEVYFSENYS